MVIDFVYVAQDYPLKILRNYTLTLKSKDKATPFTSEYTASTTFSAKGIILHFRERFQYGRLWDGVLFQDDCGGIPLSNSIVVSKYDSNIIAMSYIYSM